MDWNKDGLIGKAKAVHTTKTKEGIHSSFSMGRQMLSHLQEKHAPSYVIVILPILNISSFLYLLCNFFYWAWYHKIGDNPLIHQSQLFWLCPLPIPCAPPACSLTKQCVKQKRPWLCKHCSAITNSPWIINTVFSKNPIHTRAIGKKIKFAVAKIITTSNQIIDLMSKLIRRFFLNFATTKVFVEPLKSHKNP